MNKTTITDSLRAFAGGDWISKRRLRDYLRCSDDVRDSIIGSLDYRRSGRRILYFVPDVADQINRDVVHRNRV